MNKKRGLFIVLEGGEGVGKTTNMAFIQKYLQQQNISFVHSREPGGTDISEQIRQLILDVKHHQQMADMTELLLVFAARAQHLKEKIIPTLNQGQWLVCDRFTDATYAYQGNARGLNVATIGQLENLVQQDLRPDCTIILDADITVAKARVDARGELDRMELEAATFHQKVREGYLQRAKANPNRYAVVNAEQTLVKVQYDIKNVLDGLIARWQNG